MKALDLISATVTGNGSAETPFVPVPGCSFQIRQFSPAFKARLLGVYVTGTPLTSGQRIALRAVNFHDQVQGIQFYINTLNPDTNLFPLYLRQELISLDTLRADLLSAVTFRQLHLVVWYENLPSIDTQYIDWMELQRRGTKLKTVAVNFGASANDFSAQFPWTDLLFKQNKQYALIGFEGDINGSFLRVRIKETGNLPVGIPVDKYTDHALNYFPKLSRDFNLACIPVIDGINIPTISVQVMSQVSTNGNLYFMELD